MQQKIKFLCPEASLHVYEPEYWASDSNESLGEQSSNLLSVLESCFEIPEGIHDELWLNAQEKLIRPIIFVAHDIGGLLVEKVSHAPFQSLRPTNIDRLYYKLDCRKERTLSLPEPLVSSV